MFTPEILSIVIWPVIVLIIALAFMFGFRKSINQLISRLQKTKLPGGTEAEFGSGEALNQTEEKKLLSDPSLKSTTLLDDSNVSITQENAKPDSSEQDWFYFLMEEDYKRARELLLAEIDQTQDLEQVQALKTVAANILSHYDFNSAIEEYEHLIREHPTNSAIYSSYSWAYLNRNLPNEAITILDRGISKIKNSEYLVLQKSRILEQFQRYDEALAIANEKIESKGKDTSKYYCLIARIHKATNQANQARTAYMKAYKMIPLI